MRKVATIAALIGALALPSAPAQAGQQGFTIIASAEGMKAKFDYLASLPSLGIASGWVAGDRVGYGCAYAFLRSGNKVVGRVTFLRIEYVKVNDKRMDEGARWYNGARYTGSHRQLNDCPESSESYVEATGPIDPTPVVTFSDAATGAVLEVRDFAAVEQSGDGEPWLFQVVSAGPRRVTIVAYESGEPILAIYYDRLSTGTRVSVEA